MDPQEGRLVELHDVQADAAVDHDQQGHLNQQWQAAPQRVHFVGLAELPELLLELLLVIRVARLQLFDLGLQALHGLARLQLLAGEGPDDHADHERDGEAPGGRTAADMHEERNEPIPEALGVEPVEDICDGLAHRHALPTLATVHRHPDMCGWRAGCDVGQVEAPGSVIAFLGLAFVPQVLVGDTPRTNAGKGGEVTVLPARCCLSLGVGQDRSRVVGHQLLCARDS